MCLYPNLTLPAPKKPGHLPEHAQWLAGEGAGSWFVVEYFFEEILVNRFHPEGELESGGIYQIQGGKSLDLKKRYSVTYLSHFREIRILQNNNLVILSLSGISNGGHFKSVLDTNTKIFRDYSLF